MLFLMIREQRDPNMKWNFFLNNRKIQRLCLEQSFYFTYKFTFEFGNQ